MKFVHSVLNKEELSQKLNGSVIEKTVILLVVIIEESQLYQHHNCALNI
jgi:hypothetical protein